MRRRRWKGSRRGEELVAVVHGWRHERAAGYRLVEVRGGRALHRHRQVIRRAAIQAQVHLVEELEASEALEALHATLGALTVVVVVAADLCGRLGRVRVDAIEGRTLLLRLWL